MKRTGLFILMFLCAVNFVCFGQSVQFRYRVLVQSKHMVYRDAKSHNKDTLVLQPGTLVTSKKSFKTEGQEFEAVYVDTVKSLRRIFLEKSEPRLLSLPGWATIAVDKDDKSILHVNYWLGAKYDRNEKYYLKLENRQYASFWFNSIEGGALTIPFKYRPKFKKNNVDVPSELTADINVGGYLGYSFGKIKYMYRRNEEKDPSKWLVSIGPFLSVSKVDVDSSSSISATEPMKQKKTIAVLSPGIGLMTSINDFRFGVFVGNDWAVGKESQKWDYHNKWWFGFGFGYNLGLIWGAAK